MPMDTELEHTIIEIIRGIREPKKLVLFGSRAKGDATRTSDIDLAVFGTDWTDQDINKAHSLLEETVKTPLKFDLVHFDTLGNPRLRENIQKTGRVLYES